MRSVQSHKHYINARCWPGQVGRWNLIVARGMLKPVYFAFETMLEFFFFLQTTHFVKSRARSPRPTSKIIAMIALRHAILMKADHVRASMHAHHLFSSRAFSCKKDPCSRNGVKFGTIISDVLISCRIKLLSSTEIGVRHSYQKSNVWKGPMR